ncbi:MAG: hypothetical protein IT340_17445 [Chloroflexi bacterium]|nr:hypothetical protein [Chloroflexota bacterium]
MTQVIALGAFTTALKQLLEETVERVQHTIFLDRGTSLFETLADVSAEEASRRVAPTCACLAAQIEHVAFYLELAVQYASGQPIGPVDWAATWQRTVVTPAEWHALQRRLHAAYATVRDLIDRPATWELDQAIGGGLGILAHTAYHLGEIRQGLGVLRSAGHFQSKEAHS